MSLKQAAQSSFYSSLSSAHVEADILNFEQVEGLARSTRLDNDPLTVPSSIPSVPLALSSRS